MKDIVWYLFCYFYIKKPMSIDPQIIISLALGLGLSACCGFRVFIPLLAASVAGHMGWLPLAANFGWLDSIPAIICFSTAAVLEVLAYYIPVVDNFLDTIATPSAVIAGSVISASTFVHLDPSWQWILGIILGGGSAGIIQTGTAMTRLGSTKATAGTGNHILATGEAAAAAGGSILALLFPFMMALVIIALLLLILYLGSKLMGKKASN